MTQKAQQSGLIKRCAIYTRKSTEEGLEQAFNSLDAQREACEAYIKSQRHEGWQLVKTAYDDGGFSGGTMQRPALTRLLDGIKSGEVDIVVVYKVDRLSRSLADFVRLVELLDQHDASFVSVTQQFNTSTSMGRLTLNVLLSFAQFEREVTGERIRDKIAASKQKGMWMGGVVPLGYDRVDKQLVVNAEEAETVRHIFRRYIALGNIRELAADLTAAGIVSKRRETSGVHRGGNPIARGALYAMLQNPIYRGKIVHKKALYEGQHEAIVDGALWQAVQGQLDKHRHEQRAPTDKKDPTLLHRLLYDDQGNRMRSVYTTKQEKRYRYYTSQGWWSSTDQARGSVERISAEDLEPVVVEMLRTYVEVPHVFLSTLTPLGLSATEQQHILNATIDVIVNWMGRSPVDHYSMVQSVVDRVEVSQTQVTLTANRMGLVHWLVPDITDRIVTLEDNTVRIEAPVHFNRAGLEKRLVISGTPPIAPHPKTAAAIYKALNQALTWQDGLMTGTVTSIKAIAEKENIDARRVGLILPLAHLAPDIMMAICSGELPHTLSLLQLLQGIPPDWAEQRRVFGFPAAVSLDPTLKMNRF